MHDELVHFIDSLKIPAERKTIVLAELADHVASAGEAAVRDGRDPDAAARAALGDLEALRRSLEAIESAFRVTRWHALARGVIAGVIVAFLIDQGGMMYGAIGALLAIAIGVVFAPPRALQLLRGELRARRVPGAVAFVRGVPIGPALTYLFTVVSVPFVVWIALIVVRAFGGVTSVEVPWSAFALIAAMYAVLLVEAIRVRYAKVR